MLDIQVGSMAYSFVSLYGGSVIQGCETKFFEWSNGCCGMIITLCRHEDGRPIAMTVARGKKEDCEVSAGRALLADPQVARVNALVTADPLHNQAATVRVILDKGGDYCTGSA